MWKYTLKSLFDRKLRLSLTMLAIVLGVAFTVASFVVADSLRATFGKLVNDIEAGVDLTVRTKLDFGESADRKQVDATLLAPIRALEGVTAADGSIAGSPVIPLKANGDDVTTTGAPLLGVNYPTDKILSQLIQEDGRAPAGPTEF